jgi:hypothetical protein
MNAPAQLGKAAPRVWSVIVSAARTQCLHVAQADFIGLEARLAPRILAENWMGT